MADPNKNIDDEIIQAVVKKVTTSIKRGLKQETVEKWRDDIVRRTRVGIGIDPASGRGVRLKKLSKAYIRRRRGSESIKKRNRIDRARRKKAREEAQNNRTLLEKLLKKKAKPVKPNLTSKTTPAKSNLTATGQLLDSLTVVKLKLRKAFGFKITLADRRGRDLFGNVSKIGNKKLNEYVERQGRFFLGFTKSQRKKIIKDLRNIIIKGLK